MTHSVVEAYNVNSGRTEILLEANFRVESPNWSPDGRRLYVNGGGRLYCLTLGEASLQLVSGDATVRVSNDHGLSRDGSMVAMTAFVRDDEAGRDRTGIFLIRKAWQTPALVTSAEPSWFHGFSPDGSDIIYSCIRDDVFAIGVSPVNGGTETLVLGGPEGDGHHYDCPEFTPDGAAIWFNSDRAGTMDLWRADPQGGALHRMTQGPRADWFPHPSPDGRHVCFLSFAPGTRGHLHDAPVTLHLMPQQGGEVRTLGSFQGGNGSMNSPCWSPDGARFAYVRHDPCSTGANA
ncbi:TolB family protein [Pacificoceanicola onchidii]|uniref:TolB family protein n=1 Tax=Pacificoceanicola onchidii TaxID=2562685 RepID=UPI0014561235|nr:PD40 domain-containing protein [Pacificoceanicola onchidii]